MAGLTNVAGAAATLRRAILSAWDHHWLACGDAVVGVDNLNDSSLKRARLQPGDVPDTEADVSALLRPADYWRTVAVEDGVDRFGQRDYYGSPA